MKTIEIKLFSFNELNEKAKEKALNEHRYMEVEDDFWSEGVIENWKEILEKQGFEEPKILYSGFGSQGDGACFTCKSIDFEKFENGEYKKADVSAYIEHSYRYFFATSTNVCIETEESVSDDLSNEIEKAIKDKREEIGNKIYRDLEEAYSHATSDECIIECFEANDYTFEENGDMRNA